jgi:hypothetical protein
VPAVRPPQPTRPHCSGVRIHSTLSAAAVTWQRPSAHAQPLVVTHVVQSAAVHMLDEHMAGAVMLALHTVVRLRSWQLAPPGTSHHEHRGLFAHVPHVENVSHA